LVVAVDQRGIGLSDKPQGGYDSATLANDLVALMDALGHPRFAVYGTDVGAPIACPPTPSGTTSTPSPPTPTTCAAASSSTARSPPPPRRTSSARPAG
jgi:alpha-beta hydrolase superfamily lysophospholipase